jgi:lambda family phage tail tape measure protein
MTSTVIGQGVIEVSADSRKLKAGIEDAKRSLKDLGVTADAATKGQSASIDRYIKGLGMAAVTTGKTRTETELYTLAMRGASAQQLQTAERALKLSEAYARQEKIAANIKAGFLTVTAIVGAATIAAIAGFDALIKSAGDFQDVAEKTGDTAVKMASLSVAAKIGGVAMTDLTAASIKLTKGLIGVDDETKDAGSAIVALGLNIKDFKELAPSDQFEAVAKSLNNFKDGAEKTAVAVALFGKSGAQMLPFLKELGAEGGRQFILTQEQIKQADDYSDRQAKLRAEMHLYAQSIASNMIPAIDSFTTALRDIMKEQELAAAASSALSIATEAGIWVFQELAFAGGLVAHILNVISIEAKGAYDQMAAIGKLDWSEFSSVAKRMDADIEKSTQTLEKFSQKLLKMSEKKATPFVDERRLGPVASIADQTADMRPALKYKGGGDAIKAAEEAKARLAAEIEQIKARGESIVGINNNIDKVLEAKRGASLVDEEDFYRRKKVLLDENQAAQQDALEKQLIRYQKEKLTGKDKIDNDKKIADVQALLVKGADDAATASTLLGIQTTEAGKKTAQAFRDADYSAQSFLASMIRIQDMDLAQAGMGAKERATYAERARLETEFELQLAAAERKRADQRINGTFGVDAKKQYDDELARIENFKTKSLTSFDDYTSRKIAKEADWVNGAERATKDYIANSKDVAKQTEGLFTNAFQGMEDSLVNFVTTGKLSFASLANSIVADITRIIIKQQISNALGVGGAGSGLMSGIGAGIGAMFGTAGQATAASALPGDALDNLMKLTGGFGTIPGLAVGGPAEAGSLHQVNENGPELLQMGGKQFLMMGNQGGTVIPNDKIGGGGNTVNISVNQTFAQGTSRATTLQAATDARRQLETAGRNL